MVRQQAAGLTRDQRNAFLAKVGGDDAPGALDEDLHQERAERDQRERRGEREQRHHVPALRAPQL